MPIGQVAASSSERRAQNSRMRRCAGLSALKYVAGIGADALCRARECRRACRSSCCAARSALARAPQRVRRRLVVGQVNAALQRRRVHADLLQDRTHGLRRETARRSATRPSPRSRVRSSPKRSPAPASIDRRGDERLCGRTQVDRERRRRRRQRARRRRHRPRTRRRDAPTRRVRRALPQRATSRRVQVQTSAGSTIVASCSAKTGLLK